MSTEPAVTTPVAAPAADAAAPTRRAKYPGGTINDTRVIRYLNEQYINPSVSARVFEIKDLQEPFARAQRALKTGQEEQFDAAGKPLLNAAREPTFTPLTDARREALTKYLADNDATIKKYEEELTALQHARIRFSEETGRVVRDIVFVMIRELLTHAFDSCKLADKTIVQVSNVHAPGVEKLSCYPLIANLPKWRNPPEAVKKHTKEETAATPTQPAAAGAAQPAAAAPAQPAAAAVAVEDEAESGRGASTFKHYITEICSEMTNPSKVNPDGTVVMKVVEKKDAAGVVTKVNTVDRVTDGKYSGLRTATQFKDYMSDLIFDFFGRITPLIQRQLTVLGVKTINSEVVMSVVERIMLDGVVPTEELKYERVKTPQPEALKAVREERKKAKAEKREPTDKRTDAELPQVEELIITKVLNFNDAKYNAFTAELATLREAWPTKAEAAATPAVAAQ